MKYKLIPEDVSSNKSVVVYKRSSHAKFGYSFEVNGELICLTYDGAISFLAALNKAWHGVPYYKIETEEV